ncbi:MAG: hypothetical protein AB1513_06210 [Pseudomonadota bacterium]
MRTLTSLLTVAALAYTGFALYLYALQSRYIFPRHPESLTHPPDS